MLVHLKKGAGSSVPTYHVPVFAFQRIGMVGLGRKGEACAGVSRRGAKWCCALTAAPMSCLTSTTPSTPRSSQHDDDAARGSSTTTTRNAHMLAEG